MPTTIHITDQGNQSITGNKIFNSLRIEPSGRPFNIGTGLNINSESGIVRINTNVSSSLGAGFTYALTSGMDPNRPLDIEGRGRLVHGLSLDAGSANFTNASDHFHLFFRVLVVSIDVGIYGRVGSVDIGVFKIKNLMLT